MYALAFLGLCRSAGGVCVAGAALGSLQGVGYTPWPPETARRESPKLGRDCKSLYLFLFFCPFCFLLLLMPYWKKLIYILIFDALIYNL